MSEQQRAELVRVGVDQLASRLTLPPHLLGEVGSGLYAAMVPVMGAFGRVVEAMAGKMVAVVESEWFRNIAFMTSDDPEYLSSCLYVLAADTEWVDSLRSAYSAGDSLPWLVFADWCDENRPEWSRAARLVGKHLEGGR